MLPFIAFLSFLILHTLFKQNSIPLNTRKNFIVAVSTFLLLSLYQQAEAQVGVPKWLKKDSTYKIQPYMMVQLWGTYTHNMLADTNGDGTVEEVENRFNPHIRRARLGFTANPYPNLRYTVVAYYDGIGRDALSASIGPGNNPDGTEFGIWDAFLQWQIKPGSQALNLIGGFFRPQLGRESISSGFATTSGEKAMQQDYIRRHLVGTGPGRAVGLNLGGFVSNAIGTFHVNYNVGFFNPQNTSPLKNTVGVNWAPLLVGRAVLMFGDPEDTRYRIGYQTNFYNDRKGLSVGLGGSYQGETDIFTQSKALSIDFLFNWGRFNLDGDWHFMNRQNENIPSASGNGFVDYSSNAGHIRASFNFMVHDKILEPVVMLMRFNGAINQAEQNDAHAVNFFSGSNETFNMGFNYYLDTHRLKLLAHYIVQNGEGGRNQWVSQGALGESIERGSYFLLGLNAIF